MRAVPAGSLTEMVGAYMAEKTGMRLVPGMYQAFMVITDNDEFVAGVTISNFRDFDVEVSCASDNPLAWRPHVCRAIFTYIFEQLGCVRCTSVTSKSNKKCRSFLESLGFELEGNLRLGYDGRRDALVYGLLRDDCRFIKGDKVDGQEFAETASGSRPGSDGEGAGGAEHRFSDRASEPEPDQPVHAAG